MRIAAGSGRLGATLPEADHGRIPDRDSLDLRNGRFRRRVHARAARAGRSAARQPRIVGCIEGSAPSCSTRSYRQGFARRHGAEPGARNRSTKSMPRHSLSIRSTSSVFNSKHQRATQELRRWIRRRRAHGESRAVLAARRAGGDPLQGVRHVDHSSDAGATTCPRASSRRSSWPSSARPTRVWCSPGSPGHRKRCATRA